MAEHQPPSLLANENVPSPLIGLLRAAGLKVESVSETMPSVSDRRVLQQAVATGQWILTFDRDYGELVFALLAPPPPAILYLRQAPLTMSEYAQRVIALANKPADALGHLVVVEERRVRLRRLPSSPRSPGSDGSDGP